MSKKNLQDLKATKENVVINKVQKKNRVPLQKVLSLISFSLIQSLFHILE